MKYSVSGLVEGIDKGEVKKFLFFWGHTPKGGETVGKFVFSQWYPSPFAVEGVVYKTAEHWMMAQKAKLFGDDAIFQKIVNTDKPGEVKALGRKIVNFDDALWNESKYEIVCAGNVHKFGQDVELKNYLLGTGDHVIVEASPTDAIWGIGLSQDAAHVEDPATWPGQNLLGFALMEARDRLRI
ncbi:NADAR family protein [Chryseolinea lacunae]|uniref:NADAR family protein n=1 Tax=Chryseolinea lacunae TaxID=2801331 RepID=A0ABS1KYY0_9BACT|nr:NADAR family protein [Chryseolinea lacunae]MBL0744624.1 NADAR family protein [Chryseolinea lacunae]